MESDRFTPPEIPRFASYNRFDTIQVLFSPGAIALMLPSLMLAF
ncbi:MAG: hypothetical protein RMX96_08455 [Nostoc sp. ChiSLP02]|nr:hypothetical protein [Nostoc sp. DedSLP05]MDZ8102537.1 hypothetical protein [Nostoc sp. DedSLP01]MDZ8184868.1 hypothetical protein [Nostoc sp. ChiSLP02]